MPQFKVASADDVKPGQGHGVRIEGKSIAVFNVGGDYFAVDDRCPHMGAELSCGVVREKTVICTWHGWQFDLESGDCLNIKWAKLNRYPVTRDGDDILLTIEPDPQPEETEEPAPPEIVWKNPQG